MCLNCAVVKLPEERACVGEGAGVRWVCGVGVEGGGGLQYERGLRWRSRCERSAVGASSSAIISRGYINGNNRIMRIWGREVARIRFGTRRGIKLGVFTPPCAVMGIDRRRRASLALTLNFVALFLAVSALTTSYWCEGTRKVVKPFCAGSVTTKQSFCIGYNSSSVNDTRLVQYIWETGEDKYVMRKFHTGIWFSCEQNLNMSGKFGKDRGPVGRWGCGRSAAGSARRALLPEASSTKNRVLTFSLISEFNTFTTIEYQKVKS